MTHSPAAKVTALIAAVEHGHREVARLLLDGGADPDLMASVAERPNDNLAPLMLAAMLGLGRIVVFVLSRIHFITESQTYSVPRFTRQCDRTL